MTQDEQVVEWQWRREGLWSAYMPWFSKAPLHVKVVMDTYYVLVVGSCIKPGQNILWNSNRTNMSDCLLCIHHTVKEAKQFVEERLPAALVAATLIFQNDAEVDIDSTFWRKIGLYEDVPHGIRLSPQWVPNGKPTELILTSYPRLSAY